MSSGVDRIRAAALAAVLLLATLGEGGAAPGVMLVVHGSIFALVISLLPGRRVWGVARESSPPIGALLLFLCLAMVGALFAPYSYAALTTIQEIAAFSAVVWIASRCGPGTSGWVALPLLAGAGVQGALALHQRFIGGDARPAGTFLNPNHLAAWLVAALLVATGSMLGASRSRAFLIHAVLAVPAAAALLVTGSRGALVGLMAGTVWLAWAGGPRLGRRSRIAVVAALAVVVAVAAAGVALRARGFDPFRYQRVAIWKASMAPALDRPWTGVGPGQWDAEVNNLTFPLDGGPLRFERLVDSTHSDLIRLPAEFGWPAAIAALAGIALMVREIRRRRRGGDLDGASLGAAAALIGLGVQALVDNLSVRPAVYLLGGALAGGLLSSRAGQGGRVGLAWRLGAVPVLWVGFMAVDVGPFLAWDALRTVPSGDRTELAASEIVAPLYLNPLHPEGWMRLARHDANDPDRSTRWRYAASRTHAEHAVRLQGADARYRVGLARIEGRGFNELFRDEASRARTVAHYRAAQELARHDAGIAIEEGAFLLRAADPLGARRAAERALAIEPNSVPAKLLLAQSVVADGAPEYGARLLDDAEATAERWAPHPKETAYARFHLELDPDLLAVVRKRIAAAAAEDAPPPLP